MRVQRRDLLKLLTGLPLMFGTGVAQAAVPTVLGTTPMVADTLRQIGGDDLKVEGLMGEGVDPHLYRQTQYDILRLVRADAVFWNGLYLEAQLEAFLKRLETVKPVFALGEAVPKAQLVASGDYENHYDPHIWMDPMIWIHISGEVLKQLSKLFPANAEKFVRRSAYFDAQLHSLAVYGIEMLGQLPPERRLLITAHDAFGYFGKAFDLEVMAIQGLSTESEAGLQVMEQLVDVIVERNVPSIFVESSVSERNIRALIEGTAARGQDVRIGGSLFSDSMGPAGEWTGTLIGMLDHNITTIASALGAEVPAGGFRAWQAS